MSDKETTEAIKQTLKDAIKTSKTLNLWIADGRKTKSVKLPRLLELSDDMKRMCREVLKERK